MYDLRKIIEELEKEHIKELPPYGVSYDRRVIEIAYLKAFENLTVALITVNDTLKCIDNW